ncbi:hypothetical protein ACP4OV_017150 [Aristida adscensionis]
MAQQAIFPVLERIGSIAVDEAMYLWGVSDKLKSTKKQLLSMQAFLKDLDDKMLRGGAMARNLVSEVREVACEVEDIIDTANIMKRERNPKPSITGFISKCVDFPIYLARLHRLGARIDSANARMKTIFENFEKYNIAATAIAEEPQGCIVGYDTIKQWRSVHPDIGEQDDVIGFDDQIEQIKSDLLDQGNKHKTVVSIVGPGGAGKSTMAKKVYGLAAVKRHFEIHAWITVSQRFVARDLFKEMVKGLVPHHRLKELIKDTLRIGPEEKATKLEDMTEQDMKMLLHNFALNERYLIVLDDIWSTDAWDIISAAIPDKRNGSRVILTTRNEAVAHHPRARKKIHKPKLLNEEESTQLLLSTALPEYMLDGSSNNTAAVGQNLEEFKELGKDLALKCRGLPLAIVVLGGHLSRKPNVHEWKRLTRDMDWHALITDDRIIGGILDLSYYDMPGNMRSCFLYTTAFPEDSSIDVPVLISLWIAEGFIPLARGHTRQEVAFEYVAELAQRCMIQVERRVFSGKILVIKVHDILRDWGIGRARREGLMKDCYDAEDLEASYTKDIMEAYRVVLHGKLTRKIGASKRQLRTILDLKFSYTEVTVSSFQTLRVLYIDSPGEVFLPKKINLMRYLKYLGLGGKGKYHLPSSIGGLLSLETFHATGYIGHIPNSLWKIQTLGHVYADSVRRWSIPRISPKSKLQVMVGTKAKEPQENWWEQFHETPSNENIGLIEATERQILQNKSPGLSCCFAMHRMSYTRENQLEVVGRCEGSQFPYHLTQLRKWNDVTELMIRCTNLLRNDQDILDLGSPQTLLFLEIGKQSYTAPVITFSSSSFQHLEYLALSDLAVAEWKVERGSMPYLISLALHKCPNLRHLPQGLLWLPKLHHLSLIAMPPDCYQEGTVAWKLEKKGCVVFVSSNEDFFYHIPMSRE